MATMSRVSSVIAKLIHGVQILCTLFILAVILARLRSPPASLVSINPSLPDKASCGLESVASDTGLCDGLAALVGVTWLVRFALTLLSCITCCLCCVPDIVEAAGDVAIGLAWTIAGSLVSAEGPATAQGGWSWARGVLVASWVIAVASFVGAVVAALAACGWCCGGGGGRRRQEGQ